jgi:hypothetical protein
MNNITKEICDDKDRVIALGHIKVKTMNRLLADLRTEDGTKMTTSDKNKSNASRHINTLGYS